MLVEYSSVAYVVQEPGMVACHRGCDGRDVAVGQVAVERFRFEDGEPVGWASACMKHARRFAWQFKVVGWMMGKRS